MTNISNPATESDITTPITSGKKTQKLNFGGALYFCKDGPGSGFFQFRMRANGNDTSTTLGRYPETSLEMAKAKALKLRALVIAKRAESKEQGFLKTISKRNAHAPQRSTGFLKNLSDIGEFYHKLCLRNQLDEDMIAFTLMLLIPVKPERLLRARWSEIRLKFDEWEIKPIKFHEQDKFKIVSQREVQYLSGQALKILDSLQNVSNGSEFIFPRFSKIETSVYLNNLQITLNEIWKKYPIDLDGFRTVFKNFAIKESQFRPRLIDDAMTSINCRGEYSSYVVQRNALAKWWGTLLESLARQYSGQSVV